MNDPIIEEVRLYRQAHAAKYNNDLSAICKALQSREKASGRMVVNRPPRYVQRQAALTT
jgi:hypothetical protein